MGRFDQRQSFLLSAIVHLAILMALASAPPQARPAPVPEPPPSEEARKVVLLRPADLEELGILPPAPPRSAPRPAPTPEPPRDPARKDRISIGAPSTERAKGPLVLRREDDLTAVPKGRPDAVPSAGPRPTAEARAEAPRTAVPPGQVPERPGAEGLRLPPGPGPAPGDAGQRGRRGPDSPSIADSLRNFDRKLQATGPRGLPTGTGQQMGPLFFDPQGADFTVWINEFKNEVYRNWIVPQPALLGMRGHVDIEFTVQRDGRLTDLVIVKSAGTPALDKAAQNALVASRLLPLPADYGPPHCRMQVSFFYNEGPQGT